MMRKFVMAVLLVVAAQGLQAQVGLPSVRLPGAGLPGGGLPGVGLPLGVDRTVSTLSGDLDPRRLQDLRRLHVLDLIRSHSKSIEADPNGAAILRGEVLVFSPSDASLDKARAAGFVVLRERALDGLAARIVVLQAPAGVSTQRALKQLKALDPEGEYDFNHLYADGGVVSGSSVTERGARADDAPAWRIAGANGGTGAALSSGVGANGGTGAAVSSGVGANGGMGAAVSSGVGVNGGMGAAVSSGVDANAGATGVSAKVGLVDGGVDIAHPVFRDIVIHQHGCAGAQVVAAHGTAVASLMIGRSARFNGAAPGSELYAADVYCGLPTGGAVDAVVDALAWLVRERVPVINVSLVGPPNVMLEHVVRMVIAHGHVIVAAVGNDGPAAPPLYPASYPDVVGVTGVDARQHALLEAGRGPQVKFAAPGADMAAAGVPPSYSAVRGTSFAAPLVAGLLSAQLHEPDKAAAAQAVADLARHALDLGAPGPDPVYGFGLVGGDLRPDAKLALAK